MLSGHISPDGLWAWDGANWVPTTSPDGRWRWDGYRWNPLPALPVAAPDSAATVRVLVLAGCIVVLVGFLAIAGIVASGRRTITSPGGAAAPLSTGSSASGYPGSPPGTQVFDVPTRGHTIDPVQYPQTPPVGGLHAPAWLNCGVYDAPVPNENAVHSLEHGTVWVTYDPARLGGAARARLRDVVTSHYARGGERFVILSPYPGLPAPIVVSAWRVQLRVATVADQRIGQFIDYFRGGPETPELGGRCTGGVGTPVDGTGSNGPVTLRPLRARTARA